MFSVNWQHEKLIGFKNSIYIAQCGIFRNLLSHFFGKTSVKLTFFLNRCFDKFYCESKFFNFLHCKSISRNILLAIAQCGNFMIFLHITQILREINFLDSRSAKCAKMAVFEFLDSLKLISHKI